MSWNKSSNAPTCFGTIFKTIFRGPVDSTLSSYQVEICWYTFVIDLNLVTRQSTVHGPPEVGLKNGTETCRGKFLSVFSVNFSAF